VLIFAFIDGVRGHLGMHVRYPLPGGRTASAHVSVAWRPWRLVGLTCIISDMIGELEELKGLLLNDWDPIGVAVVWRPHRARRSPGHAYARTETRKLAIGYPCCFRGAVCRSESPVGV